MRYPYGTSPVLYFIWNGGKAERPYLSLPVFKVKCGKSARMLGILVKQYARPALHLVSFF